MSEARYQSYSLSPVGGLIARSRMFQAALDAVHSPDNPEPTYAKRSIDMNLEDPRCQEAASLEAWREMRASELYAAFTEEDRHEAMRYASRLTQSELTPEWKVEGRFTSKQDGFFAFVEADAERRVPAAPSDLGVLTGYAALDMFRFGLGDISPEGYANQGFRSLLQFAQFLGACSIERLNRASEQDQGAAYTARTGHSVARLVAVAADKDENLTISASEHYPMGAADPLGARQKFAPDEVGTVTLSARPGSESGMLTTMMWWANAIGVPEKVQKRYFTCAVYEAMHSRGEDRRFPAEKFSMNFESISVLGIDGLLAAMTEQDPETSVKNLGHITLGNQLVSGSGTVLGCYVRQQDNSLILRGDHGFLPLDDDQVTHIAFPPEEMYLLTRALVEQTKKGIGRTPFETMAGMIAYRFSPEFRAFVAATGFRRLDYRLGEQLARFYSFGEGT